MYAAGHPFSLMSAAEIECIHRNALRILSETGMEIQNRKLLDALSGFGVTVDIETRRARFPQRLVETYLVESEKTDWNHIQPHVGGSAGVYHGRYHDPRTLALLPWSEERLAFYFFLARRLPMLNGATMLGCQLPVPAQLEPLYERYYCWKLDGTEGSSIYLDEICPYLLELYQARAADQGKPVQEVFHGTVYLVPALKLGVHEAHQVAYFWERGLRVGIGDMYAMGANAPATLAGAVTLNLAEQIALRILDWALFGDKHFYLGGSLSVMDMRTMIYPYGRPEMAITNLMIAQLARHYGAAFQGHAGLSDAKLPSVEAGYQKALTALPTLLAGGSFWMDAGLLSTDEVFSPIQMILDNEFLSALKRFVYGFEISDESIGIDTILNIPPGGQYLDSEHTVHNFRKEHWQPSIWSQQMLEPWLHGSHDLDADRARQVALDLLDGFTVPNHLSPGLEKDLNHILLKAGKEFGIG
jgi:trimethylamine---corrinoid protein Co-methyltransferase